MQQRNSSKFSSPLISRLQLSITSLFLWLMAMFCTLEGRPLPEPFEGHEYPTIDLRLLDWPLAQKTNETEAGKQFTQLECYTELDRTFVDPKALYRVNNTGQLNDRACMLRIPTGTRLTVQQMHVHHKKSYVTVVAGSSQVFMPLRTEHIHEGETERYGPWHVPCQQAYMVFSSKSHHHRLEWVEFRLSEEGAEDRHQVDNSICTGEGVNHAEVEYGHGQRDVAPQNQSDHQSANDSSSDNSSRK